MSLAQWKPIPTTSNSFEHQVAGHGLELKKSAKFLTDGENIVLKPVQPFPKGQAEVAFYQNIFASNNNDEALLQIRPYLPTYHGIYYNAADNVYYLGLENVLSSILNPSIIDLKMGQKSYSPNDSVEKVEGEKKKYKYRESVGFLITGCKIYDVVEKKEIFHDRYYGRQLNAEEVYTKGILKFLGSNRARAARIAQSFHSQLQNLLSWFTTQKRFSFIASSILLAYGQSKNQPNEDVTVVKWVDFTHVFDADKCSEMPHQLDESFLFGLRNLSYLLSRVELELMASS